MEEVNRGKEEVDNVALTYMPKPCLPGEKKRMITNIQ